MKKTKFSIFIVVSVVVFAAIIASCKKTDPQPQEQLNEEPNLTASYDYYSKHKVNSDVATLGRVLFYDRKLSSNNAVSCGSCHKQEFAFADNVQFNKGFNGMALTRNSPSIQGIKGFINQRFGQSGMENFHGRPTEANQTEVLLFWDGRQKNIADMVLNPVLNHKEMNMPDFATLEKKLAETSYYGDLFTKAYGDAYISTGRIAFALQGFMACLNTDTLDPKMPNQNSHPFMGGDVAFDQNGFPIKTQPTSTLTGLAEEGRKLFHTKYNCAKCHDPGSDPENPDPGGNGGSYGSVTTPQVTFDGKIIPLMFNIGLDEVYGDKGLGNITGKPGDHGLFKVPTLKNISKTAPYMHDGRFKNLSEVIDHYSHDIKDNKNLSPLFRAFNGQPKKLNVTAVEKKALIAFLNTLTDPDFLTNPMYSDPFKK